MITAINANNIGAYTSLFDEAGDILSGYERVRTYDTKVDDYFYRNDAATDFENLFVKVESITDLKTFA